MASDYFEGVKERFKLYFPFFLKATGITFIVIFVLALLPDEYQVKTKDGGEISIKKENVNCKREIWPPFTAYNSTLSFDTGRDKSGNLVKKKEVKKINTYAYECNVYGVKEDLIGYESIYKKSSYCLKDNRNSIPCKAAVYHNIIAIDEMDLYKLK